MGMACISIKTVLSKLDKPNTVATRNAIIGRMLFEEDSV